jgi:endonuclease III
VPKTKTETTLTLADAIGRLEKLYGPPAPPATADPFELILLENIAYLATPAKRREAFERLKAKVGTTPAAVLAAKQEVLEGATSYGILDETSAEKLRECARIAEEELGGNLDAVVAGPLDEAKRALRLFPGIGEPGAEKILLFSGRHPLLAPESNGLRVLVRVGLVREGKSYAKTYASSRVTARGLPAKVGAMQKAHLLLQQHGQTLCTRVAPRCDECPLAPGCAYAKSDRRREG